MSLLGKTIAVIGTGAMGSATCRGLLKAGAVEPTQIIATDVHHEKVEALVKELGIRSAGSNVDAARQANIIMLCVKPYLIHDVVEQIAGVITPENLVITIAAGIPTARIEDLLPPGTPVIRAMPNTCAIVGAGAAAYSRGRNATEQHAAAAHEIFTSFGEAVEVEEHLLNAVTAISGSGPAYAYLMIEALSDGGVRAGLPRDIATFLAAQTLLGAAKMVLETGMHPAQLKDMVTTPAGTTIAALVVMERAGVRSALIEAVAAAIERANELS